MTCSTWQRNCFTSTKHLQAMNLNLNADPESDKGYFAAALTGLLFLATLFLYVQFAGV
jgi:hypothetical protein